MGARHPKACSLLLDHLFELEAMFDVCIVSGFSMGIPKAILAATSGPMLGNNAGRHGRTPNGERVQGVWEFAPLKNPKNKCSNSWDVATGCGLTWCRCIRS